MATKRNGDNLEVRVALAGLGTVGSGVVRLLFRELSRYRRSLRVELKLVSILDRSYQRKDTSWIGGEVQITDSLSQFLAIPADVLVELLGDTDPADEIIRKGLSSQKAVVTANKLLMARHGEEYLRLARQKNAYLGFEASVAGGIPVVRVLRRSLISDQLMRIRGILNGTCNFILSEMCQHGQEYQDALARAQSLGYAESDPTLDVSGGDTADKLAILSTICFRQGILPHQVPTHGITEVTPVDFLYAGRLDATIKLLGVAMHTDGHLSLRVSPFLIKNSMPLANISGVLNAVEIEGATLGSVVLSGRGAGANPTAVSVVSDILNAALWKKSAQKPGGALSQAGDPVGGSQEADPDPDLIISEQHERYPFYIRFFVKDSPGIISALSSVLAEREINIDSILQESWPNRANLPFIITVEATHFSGVRKAVAEMAKFEFNCIPPVALPMLVE